MSSHPKTFVVATWNVLHQSPLKKYMKCPRGIAALGTTLSAKSRRATFLWALHECAAHYNVDAVCLQEVSPEWLKDADVHRMFHVYQQGTVAVLLKRASVRGHGNKKGGEGAITATARLIQSCGDVGTSVVVEPSTAKSPLSRFFSSSREYVTNHVLSVCFTPSACTSPDARPVKLMSTHLPYHKDDRDGSGVKLSRGVWCDVSPDKTPNVVLCGDLNISAPDQPEQYSAMVDGCPLPCGSVSTTLSHNPPFTARYVHDGSPLTIDHVLTSLPVERVAVYPPELGALVPHGVDDGMPWVPGAWPSDHAMLIAELPE
eukprot:PhM_4_TR15353/c0_g1_i1/m.42304